MAGKPKKQAMIAALERRTLAELEDGATHTDYALAWLESGGTVLSLADALGQDINQPIMRATLSRYLSEQDSEWEERGRRARARGSYAMVEKAADLAETADTMDKEKVPGAKLKIDTKLKVAAMFNRDEFGERKGTSITVNVGNLHLDAMRRRELPNAIAHAIASDAEVLSIEETTS